MAVFPRYYEIKADIRQKINDGHYKPKEALPSEPCLQKIYGVSRITVRKALDDLYTDGLIYKIQGKGTFVEDSRKQKITLTDDSSCTAYIKNCGYKATRTMLRSEIVTDDGAETNNFLVPGQRYFLLECVFEGDGIPIVYVKTYYLYDYVKGIEKYDFKRESITQILAKQYGLFSYMAHKTRAYSFSAVLSDEKINEIMKDRKSVV